MYLNVGEKGTSLKEIINIFGNKDYDVIECRIKYLDEYTLRDELFGYCQYKNGELLPLDHDTYSLNDLYIEWQEWTNDRELWLTVWADGYLTDS